MELETLEEDSLIGSFRKLLNPPDYAEAAALRLTKSFFEELLLVVEAGERRRLSKVRETMESQNISS